MRHSRKLTAAERAELNAERRRGTSRYVGLPAGQRKLVSILLGGYGLLLINSAFLLLFERSTAIVYMSNVLLHICLGILLIAPVVAFLVMHLARMPIRMNWRATGAGAFTALSLVTLLATGIALVAVGSSYGGGWILWLHLTTAVTSVLGFVLHVSLKRGLRFHFLAWGDAWSRGMRPALKHPLSLTVLGGTLLLLLFVAVPWITRGGVFVASGDGIVLAESQSLLAENRLLRVDDLARSESCGQEGCHPDVYEQWSESMHRFSSFNNPYYKASVELMIERSGAEPTRWCASCHDPVLLFSGRFEEAPIDTDHWSAHEGLTCLSCHAVEGLRDVKGNGRYVISSPEEYPFARAEAGAGKWVHNLLVRAKPEPHRRAMLKPVHETPEFCGSCHKVGIPPEVNNYRWKRGQNEYDNWHASGVSGNTVRSFYLPDEPSQCATCHMPLVPSDDMGNDGGLVRDHRFAAANTAVPSLNGHDTQLERAQAFLAEGRALIDIFQVSVNGRTYGPDDAMPVLRPGDRVALDVVLRSRGVGHTLPGGTNDSNELWVALRARNERGETVLASGALDAAGRVDSTAHFLGAVLVDRASRPIDKRNAQDWIANVYMNVIGPGAARNVHYRFVVPPGIEIASLEAALQHRKFKWYYNEWVFRGRVAEGSPDSLSAPEVDRRTWILGDGEAPELPITTMAGHVRSAGQPAASERPLWERWNDFGIGRLLESDTRGALSAFERVAELAPENPEGSINMARVLVEEGQLDRAVETLAEAEQRRPGYLKTAYFRGEVYRASGEYDRALEEWMAVYERYPADRVLVLGIGRIHYLVGRYEMALTWFDRVLDIDPEDVGALYNKMLALGALGREEAYEQALAQYEYHKADEDAPAVASPHKQTHPMDNREAQALHEHELHPVRTPPSPLESGLSDAANPPAQTTAMP
ncbi:MAG: tetratricopeptide repeat protein [Rhodothermales bacterium]